MSLPLTTEEDITTGINTFLDVSGVHPFAVILLSLDPDLLTAWSFCNSLFILITEEQFTPCSQICQNGSSTPGNERRDKICSLSC
ncbi:hypothetical protein Y1Q_0016159 [Alligator mississippiensis]|uniref:Uncharacterized protein n=1 Tax=Alligator mississippiensis TaxID=8496 RepID=A0A151P166_ALLMI|nr:hypothetical protein Y1Q_0016159 [Alligator mississippiensis]